MLTSLSFRPSFLDFHKILEQENISENPAIKTAGYIIKEHFESTSVLSISYALVSQNIVFTYFTCETSCPVNFILSSSTPKTQGEEYR
jgi:hypothetical protein